MACSGVSFPGITILCLLRRVSTDVPFTLHSDSLKACETAYRCVLCPQKAGPGARDGFLHLVPYLPCAKWSPGLGNHGQHAVLCQVLRASQKCARQCVIFSPPSRQRLLVPILTRCMQVQSVRSWTCFPVGGPVGGGLFVSRPSWAWGNRGGVTFRACLVSPVCVGLMTVRVATVSDNNGIWSPGF